ncbi:MAG: FAD-binding oxidoreductase, partial [Hydrogenophaga sp.]|nr:FAD-binding oxidoreductase [Hydrogenophaga sp.]
MRKIMIVGAGQAGLQLGISLLQRGYRVSITSNRTPEDLRTGKVLSSQCMFHDSLQLERDRGLNFWEPDCPPVEGISFTVPHPELPGEKAMSWGHRLDHKAQSVDQRVKVPGWMAEFSRLGGELLMHEA